MPHPSDFGELRNFEIRRVVLYFQSRSVKGVQFILRMELWNIGMLENWIRDTEGPFFLSMFGL
jgi:hypothetical protein